MKPPGSQGSPLNGALSDPLPAPLPECRLFMVRHGPTHAKSMVGWSDLPADLSDVAQITAVRDWLPEQARLVSSDLRRTRDTADSLARPGHNRLPDDPALREIHFGEWELKTFPEVEASDPAISRRFWTTPGTARPPGGESWNDMSHRVSAAVDTLAARGGDLILVVHFAVILSQVARFSGESPAEVLRHKINPLSITRIDLSPEGAILRNINHEPLSPARQS